MRRFALASLLVLAIAGCGGGSGPSSSAVRSVRSSGGAGAGRAHAPLETARVALAQRTIRSYCLRAINHLSSSGLRGMVRSAHRIEAAATGDPAAYRDDLRSAIRRLGSCDPRTARRLRATFERLP